MNNAAQKVTRIDKDAWEIATELANEYGVSICHIISESVRYCAENAEFKEMDVVVKRLVVGSSVIHNMLSYGLELAVLKHNKETDLWDLDYKSGITDDLIGYIKGEEELEEILIRISNL